jgi:hypothetical protein
LWTGQESHHEAIHQGRLFHLRGVAALRYSQKLSLRQQPGRHFSLLRIHDAILAAGHEERRLRHIWELIADPVLHRAANGSKKAGPPRAAREVVAIVAQEAQIDHSGIVEDTVDQGLWIVPANPFDYRKPFFITHA